MVSHTSFSSNMSARISEHDKGDRVTTDERFNSLSSTSSYRCHVALNDCDKFEEPPVSLMSSGNTSINGLCFNIPLNNTKATKISPSWNDTKLCRSSSYIPLMSSLQDMSGSPLTASSFHVMERAYDNDTWRMFNRIASSRIQKPSIIVENAHEAQQSENRKAQHFSAEGEVYLDEDSHDEKDCGIFDLDME
jgi:hypothetical protein